MDADALTVALVAELLQHVAGKGRRVDDVVGRLRGVEHRESVVVARREADVARPAFADGRHPGLGVESGRIEASGELFVFAVVQVEVGHRPLALRQHGVEPPVEEDAETGVGELLPRGKVFRSRTVAGLGCGREREQRGAAQGAEMLHCLVR